MAFQNIGVGGLSDSFLYKENFKRKWSQHLAGASDTSAFTTWRTSNSLCTYDMLRNAFPKDLSLKLNIQASSSSPKHVEV